MRRLFVWEQHHKNILIVTIGVLFGIFLYKYDPFHNLLLSLGSFGYVGAFIAGILYDSTATVSTSIVILLVLAEKYSKLELGIIAGLGAVIGDYVIFKFVKNGLMKELKPMFQTVEGEIEHDIGRRRIKAFGHMLHSKYFHWALPVVGAILIGSPFPNELAWGLMGATKLKDYQVIIMSFIVNFAGIFFILTISNFVRP